MKLGKKLSIFVSIFVFFAILSCSSKTETSKIAEPDKVKTAVKSIDIKTTFSKLGFKPPNTSKITKLPYFEVEDITGRKVKSSEFKNKFILLTFWATWCPFCSKELPTTEKLYQKTKDNPNFQIVSVCLNQDKDSIPLYAEMQGYNFPILLDPENELYKTFRDELRTPVSYLIAKDGSILGEIISSSHDWSTDVSFNFFQELSKKDQVVF